ncbi:MAG TPA: hypothetical protein VK553_02720, partial [Candidatus Nitrosopolaris rasttigaisensis]|nr:hypothetical protein [Candidatus Nitrosopolaris rasttigaisensis]
AAIHEQGNVEKEVESLKAVEKNIEGKDRREQKKVLWSEKEVLRKYEDMQALVQRSERDFQGQWLTEQSRLVGRYKGMRDFLSQKRNQFTKFTAGFLGTLGGKFDIDGFYHSLSPYKLNIHVKKNLVMTGQQAGDLLGYYEKVQESYELQGYREKEKQYWEKKAKEVGKILDKSPMQGITRVPSIVSHVIGSSLELIASDERMSKEKKKEFIWRLKDTGDVVIGDAKLEYQNLAGIKEDIDEHRRQQPNLQRRESLLTKVLTDTDHYLDGDRGRIENDYQEFTETYGINKKEDNGQQETDRGTQPETEQTTEKQLPEFEEACAIYKALINGKKNNTSDEEVEANIADKRTKAKVRKAVVECYLFVVKGDDSGSMQKYIQSVKPEMKTALVADPELKNVISLVRLLKQEDSCYDKITSQIKQQQQNMKEEFDVLAEEIPIDPKAKEDHQRSVTKAFEDGCKDFKKDVRSDLLFEAIIHACESWQNEISDAMAKLVSQEEESLASKQDEIENLGMSLQELRAESSSETKAFIQEAESQGIQGEIKSWLGRGSTLFEKVGSDQHETWPETEPTLVTGSDTEQTRVMESEPHFGYQKADDHYQKMEKEQNAIDVWLKRGQDLLMSEIEQTQAELEKQRERLQKTPGAADTIDAETSFSSTDTLMQKEIQEKLLSKLPGK